MNIKNNILNWIYLAALMLAIVSCNTYEPPVPAGSITPVFYAQGEINGESFTMKADGERFEASSRQIKDSLGVTLYSGSLTPAGCDQFLCANAIALDFRGEESLTTDVTSKGYDVRDAVMRSDEYDLYTITLSPVVLGAPVSCTWTIDGVEEYTTNELEELVIQRKSSDASEVEVELRGEFANGCISSITDHIYLPNHPCDVEITTKQLSDPLHILFSAETTNASSYSWEFESGITASSEEVEYRFNTIPNDGVETVGLTVNRNGCEAMRSKNVLVSDSLAQCNINVGYSISSEVIKEELDAIEKDLGTVQLMWIGQNGIEYRSESITQPEWSAFKVLSDTDYTEPLLGDEPYAKKVIAEFSAKLVSDQGEEIDLRNVRVVLPIGQYQ